PAVDDVEMRDFLTPELLEPRPDVDSLDRGAHAPPPEPPAPPATGTGTGVGSAATPLRSPMPRRFDNIGLRAIRNTVGRLKKYTTNRSRAVQNPRVSAKPRTDPIETKYRTAAAVAVTMSAAQS